MRYYGLAFIALSITLMLKPDFYSNIGTPTFIMDKLNTSARGSYQLIGLLLFLLGSLMLFGILGS
ncbi:MAG: hypothetical protein ACRCXZ_06315 [Patescibacteria group bacterium]